MLQRILHGARFHQKVFTFGREKPAEEQAPAEVSPKVETPVVEQEALPVADVSPASEFAEPSSPPLCLRNISRTWGDRREGEAPAKQERQAEERVETAVSSEPESPERPPENHAIEAEHTADIEADVVSEETSSEPISPLVGKSPTGQRGEEVSTSSERSVERAETRRVRSFRRKISTPQPQPPFSPKASLPPPPLRHQLRKPQSRNFPGSSACAPGLRAPRRS